MKIYRIDGNRCFKAAEKGISYHLTKELAVKHLEKCGFNLETRKWKNNATHYEDSEFKWWYNIKLSPDGHPYDNTSYRTITEVEVDEE